jgi:hypothetical protein
MRLFANVRIQNDKLAEKIFVYEPFNPSGQSFCLVPGAFSRHAAKSAIVKSAKATPTPV